MGELAPLVAKAPQAAVWLTSVPLPRLPGVKATLALALPAVAVPMVGGDGKVTLTAGVTVLAWADQGLVPQVLTVLTLQA